MSATSTRTRPAPTRGRFEVSQTTALAVDAAASATVGAVLAIGSRALAEPLGIPPRWLLGLGLFMLVYAADLALVASRPRWRRFTPVIAAGKAGWVVASVVLVLAGGFDLTGLGIAVVLGQAAIVAGFVALQARASA